MLQYLLTAIAGLALGVVGMRLWQMKDAPGSDPVEKGEPTAAPAATTTAASAPGSGNRRVLIGAGIVGVIAIAIFALKPADTDDTAAGVMSANMPAKGAAPQLDDVDSMIARLAERLQKNPNDGEGFRMLGWSYMMTGHPDRAIEPFKRALALLPNSAVVHSGYGEALTMVAGGTVTPEAKAEFDKAQKLDANEPRSRYFAGTWLAQNGKEREALDKWIALANSGAADAPWQTEVRQKIAEVSKKLGIDISSRLKTIAGAMQAPSGPDAAAMQAAAQLPENQRQAMVDQMVEGLAGKLKANPKDTDGWIKLLRSRMVMKQDQKAADDLAIARRSLAGDKEALARINAAAAQFGVPGAK